MRTQEPQALTVGEIARRLGCPVHRIEYLIRSRGMRPSYRAGNARVFTQAQFEDMAGAISHVKSTG